MQKYKFLLFFSLSIFFKPCFSEPILTNTLFADLDEYKKYNVALIYEIANNIFLKDELAFFNIRKYNFACTEKRLYVLSTPYKIPINSKFLSTTPIPPEIAKKVEIQATEDYFNKDIGGYSLSKCSFEGETTEKQEYDSSIISIVIRVDGDFIKEKWIYDINKNDDLYHISIVIKKQFEYLANAISEDKRKISNLIEKYNDSSLTSNLEKSIKIKSKFTSELSDVTKRFFTVAKPILMRLEIDPENSKSKEYIKILKSSVENINIGGQDQLQDFLRDFQNSMDKIVSM